MTEHTREIMALSISSFLTASLIGEIRWITCPYPSYWDQFFVLNLISYVVWPMLLAADIILIWSLT
jgi:hypothetical protein